MAKFRKKPVVIDAVQFDGENLGVIVNFVEGTRELRESPEDKSIVIRTLEGDMRADKGDWIIKGVKGEFYPCKPDIFEATYEIVEA